MKALFVPLLAASLAGCATTYISPVEVTRFADPAPDALARGAIAIVPAAGQPGDPAVLTIYEAAVEQRLRTLGFHPSSDLTGMVAEVALDQAVDRLARRSPVSVGFGGSTGSYGSGIGGGIGIDLTPRPAEVIDSELRVTIRVAGSPTALWEGRARFAASANSPLANQSAAADRLAGALFAGFPGRSGETITVR